MNKRLLIRNIVGTATESERKKVIEWVNRSKQNESYYINLLNLIVSQDVSKEGNQFFSEEDIREKLIEVNERIRDKKRVRRPGFYIASAIAAASLLLFSVLLNIYQFNTKEEPVKISYTEIAPKTEVINTFYTDRGVKGKILLEDSTVVWLNSDSKIVYPEHFSGDSREVKFEGEGFFEVAKNPECPMVVTTAKGMTVKVLGTKFHIKSYNNDDTEQATLFAGKIELAKKIKGQGGKLEQRKIEMIPNETVIFKRNGFEQISLNTDTTKKVAWKRGELLFEETPMSEVVKMLERWHGVVIVVSDDLVLRHQFTGSFNSESLVQILELLKFTSPIDYSIVNNRVYLKMRKI